MKIAIFSHGKQGNPQGKKINILRTVAENQGFETYALDYTKCKDAKQRITKLKQFIAAKPTAQILLVGSSMGGYISTALANDYELMGLFLLCPAIYMPKPEYEVQNYSPKCGHIEIIHGWNDATVPFENSIKFGQQTKAVLHLVNDNHRLANSHHFIAQRFQQFLSELTVVRDSKVSH